MLAELGYNQNASELMQWEVEAYTVIASKLRQLEKMELKKNGRR